MVCIHKCIKEMFDIFIWNEELSLSYYTIINGRKIKVLFDHNYVCRDPKLVDSYRIGKYKKNPNNLMELIARTKSGTPINLPNRYIYSSRINSKIH